MARNSFLLRLLGGNPAVIIIPLGLVIVPITLGALISLGNQYIPLWTVALTGLPAIITAILSYLNGIGVRRMALKLAEHQEKLSVVAEDVSNTKKQVNVLETNTNSIKDALVSATRDAAHSAGIIEGTKTEQERMSRPEK